MQLKESFIVFFAVFVHGSICLSFTTASLKFFKRKAFEIIDHAVPKDDCSRHLKAWIGDLFHINSMWAMKKHNFELSGLFHTTLMEYDESRLNRNRQGKESGCGNTNGRKPKTICKIVLDASAKLQSGLFSGNIFHFGDFDGCLNIREDKVEMGLIEGKYCAAALLPAQNSTSDLAQMVDLVTLTPQLLGNQDSKSVDHILKLVKFIYGICLPKSCSADNIQKLWNHLEHLFRLPVHVAVAEDFCSHKGKVAFEFASDRVVHWWFGLYLVFVCAATALELFMRKRPSVPETTAFVDLLISFSLYKNSQKILKWRPNAGSDATFSCLDGLKVLSMFWIIFGHVYIIELFTGTTNMIAYFQWRKTFASLLVLMAPFAVDTFLVISGLLLSYKYLHVRLVLGSNRPFPLLMFYLGRFLRLWPGLATTILLYTNILKYVQDGPFWPLIVHKMAISCSHSGWLTALFATNFVTFHNQCVEPTWYLGVDVQLYSVAPFLLFLLYKYPKGATLCLFGLCVWSATHAYNVTVLTREKWALSEGDNSFFYHIYHSTFVRMPPWILGIFTGALLFHYPQLRLPKILAALLWASSAAIVLGIAVAHKALMARPYNEYHAGLFNATARSAWAVAICLLILLCSCGHGGLINKILSLHLFRPLAKMSYSVFLLHYPVLMALHGGKRVPGHHSTFKSFQDFIADMPFILLTSFVWCLMFESPFINLAKLWVKQGAVDATRAVALPESKDKKSKKAL